MEQGYAICLNKWSLDTRITNELGLLLIISSLSAKTGYCYATNGFLAQQFKTTTSTISKKITKLKELAEFIPEPFRYFHNCINSDTIQIIFLD